MDIEKQPEALMSIKCLSNLICSVTQRELGRIQKLSDLVFTNSAPNVLPEAVQIDSLVWKYYEKPYVHLETSSRRTLEIEVSVAPVWFKICVGKQTFTRKDPVRIYGSVNEKVGRCNLEEGAVDTQSSVILTIRNEKSRTPVRYIFIHLVDASNYKSLVVNKEQSNKSTYKDLAQSAQPNLNRKLKASLTLRSQST